jgi:hypothetical protein
VNKAIAGADKGDLVFARAREHVSALGKSMLAEGENIWRSYVQIPRTQGVK